MPLLRHPLGQRMVLARAVYERDGWDEMLVAWGEDEGWSILWPLEAIFYAARLCVMVTRGLLWLFLMLGQAISFLLERQMEYDADRYGARLIGSTAYEDAARRIMTLAFAGQAVDGLVAEALRKGEVPDDLPGRVVAGAESFSKKQQRQLQELLTATRTGLFDTHPAFPDRMAVVRREKAPGTFAADRPAADLFRDYRQLAREVTQDLYRRWRAKARRPDPGSPAATGGWDDSHRR